MIVVIVAVALLIFALILAALLFKLIFHFLIAAALLILIAAAGFLVWMMIRIGRRVERLLDRFEGREADADLDDVEGFERRQRRRGR